MPIMQCPACAREIPDGSVVCPFCAQPVAAANADAGSASSDDDPTLLGGPPLPAGATPVSYPSATGRPVSEADSSQHGRFLPGTTVDGRYRIVGLLGRGGMGEVYRADDLKLGQQVALKFLPDRLTADSAAVQLLVDEVRMARKVSHPNVCRVFDIADTEGHHYVSMEYVDGEDLASLLRRIGQLPEAKAVEIARQLCAALAAAHDEGVLHRDLKPANIMLDGRGRVKLTDFGLSAVTETRAGTPIYMAPEQLAGEAVTPRSDVYSLGLVLHELFTGQRVFEADNFEELTRQHQSSESSPRTRLAGLDPAVDRVIHRCLEEDPAKRPASALAVAAGLPGADPLAAALAAGETPSPEMVAEAGGEGSLPLRRALPLLLVALVFGVTVGVLQSGLSLVTWIPFDKSPQVLEARALEVVSELGYPADHADTAFDFETDLAHIRWLAEQEASPERWQAIRDGRSDSVHFWWRSSPRVLVPDSGGGITPSPSVTLSAPPRTRPGMISMRLDTQGRLLWFDAVPPKTTGPPAAGEVPEVPGTSPDEVPGTFPGEVPGTSDDGVPGTSGGGGQVPSGEVPGTSDDGVPGTSDGGVPDGGVSGTSGGGQVPGTSASIEPGRLFALMGLDLADFTAVEPRATPDHFADERRAWEGAFPGDPDTALRIEVAALGGRPVSLRRFTPFDPLDPPQKAASAGSGFGFASAAAIAILLGVLAMFLTVIFGGLYVARRNVRSGRGDARGARRLGFGVAIALGFTWLLGEHTGSANDVNSFVRMLIVVTALGALTWALYLAVEPFMRRHAPGALIGWTRVVDGRLADPLVGRDLLLGCAAGAAARLLEVVPLALGERQDAVGNYQGLPADSLAEILGSITAGIAGYVMLGLGMLFLYSLSFIALKRRPWAAWATWVFFFGSIGFIPGININGGRPSESLYTSIFWVLGWALLLFVLFRLGILVFVAMATSGSLLEDNLPSLDFSAWYGWSMTAALLLFFALAAYAFYRCVEWRGGLAEALAGD